MSALTDRLGMRIPLVAAPMAGGGTTPALAAAAAAAGAYPFLAGGYLAPDALAERIAELRRTTDRFGVNLFAPNPVPVDPRRYAAYADRIRPDADRLGATLPPAPVEDDDAWAAKLDVLLAERPEVASFTFGIPPAGALAALRRAGVTLLQTVTSADEARAAVDAGVDGLVVQASAAGGHWGTLTPGRPPEQLALPELVRAVRDAVSRGAADLPIVAAGGVGGPSDVRAALEAGASAVAVGTLLLRSDESGASATHRAALADPRFTRTALTRAFTGRPARGLVNAFLSANEDAPLGYPALHHLTSGMRKAAAAAGDADRVHLWAGTGWQSAASLPAATILTTLAAF
ncbi:nitronate monooxygenase [Leifsonia sp. NPDC080035]|uniref:Propionate 3-nitronate monooxygenase n=1 Tax=Leifsonia sp. NPDC080035 TaxID=3143936 RepID=A0AAU7GHC1_9MICO